MIFVRLFIDVSINELAIYTIYYYGKNIFSLLADQSYTSYFIVNIMKLILFFYLCFILNFYIKLYCLFLSKIRYINYRFLIMNLINNLTNVDSEIIINNAILR